MEEAVSNQHSAVSEKPNQHQRRFTTEDTEATEEGKTLPVSHGKPGQANADEQELVKQRAEALAVKLAQTYEELTRLLERNPGVKRQMTEGTANPDKVYQKLKQRLKLADMAPRCRWVRQGGTSCGSPQMKQHIYCFAHMQMANARELMLRLPPPEDANAIQVGLMRIQKALLEDTISTKKAGLLLYSMQLALTNVGQTTFGQAKDEEMVRETVDEEEAFSSQHSAVSEKQHQNQRPFTAEGAEDAKKNQDLPLMNTDDTDKEKGLPRMDADERGLKPGSRPVEWKPSPDMYRMDTREGIEAYEASFRMKIRTSGDREATPPKAAVPHEHTEIHAILG
ncbi:MAG TPA: hypothetical protein VFQ41_15005 [Candidatus Angelobacter sp.]|nr:hypothetical protein [Candidatus Angelobacter sp.]